MKDNKLMSQHQRMARGEPLDGQRLAKGGTVKGLGVDSINQGKLEPVKPSSGAPGKPKSLKGPISAGKGSTGKEMKKMKSSGAKR